MGQDFNKVEAMVTELDELEAKLSDPATHSNQMKRAELVSAMLS